MRQESIPPEAENLRGEMKMFKTPMYNFIIAPQTFTTMTLKVAIGLNTVTPTRNGILYPIIQFMTFFDHVTVFLSLSC